MTITARVHNHAIALPADVEVAEGAEVQITLPDATPSAKPNRHAWLLKHAGIVDDLPPDAALEHDHYLYGTPKKHSNP